MPGPPNIDIADAKGSIVLTPLLRAMTQLTDRTFLGVLWQSLLWAALSFALLLAGTIWSVHHLIGLSGGWAWAADLLSGVGAALLAFWLFLPVAAGIGMLFTDRIAAAVERRYYPTLPPAAGAPLSVQVWDGIAVGARILLLNAVALVLALLIPGVGWLLGWAIGAFAIGRGLFVAVAMRRMERPAAEALYRRERLTVLIQGAVMALAGFVPVLNLLIPLVGTAAMVHVLDRAVTAPQSRR